MFFSAYLGEDKKRRLWQEVMEQHANWLGLVPQTESRNLDDGRNFSFGWLRHKKQNRNAPCWQETEEYLIMDTLNDGTEEADRSINKHSWQEMIANLSTNVVRIGVSLRSGEFKVIVPPATAEQFYFSKDSRGYLFGNDLRLMLRWTGLEIDERAIYALFQYFAVPSPITIAKAVQRIPGGHLLKVLPGTNEPVFELFFQPGSRLEKKRRTSNPEMQVQQTLDNILKDIPKSAVLYFSGGVDSSLLAARLAEMGRRDVTLVNYIFGPRDLTGQHALKIAAHLRLRCEQIMYKPTDIPRVLERLGKDYSYPFSDCALIPTNLLLYGSLPWIGTSSAAIGGDGADIAFGETGLEYPLWNRLYSVPYFARRTISAGYKWLKLWQRYNSKTEILGRAFRRSVQMPLQQESIAKNSLDGIAYLIPNRIRETLDEIIKTRIQVLGSGLSPEEQFSLLELAHAAANKFAAKYFDPLRRHGIKAISPFLEPPMINLSLALQKDEKYPGGEAKQVLKKLLARSLSRELVHKSGNAFIPPIKEMFAHPSMQEFLRNVAISRKSSLANFYRTDTVKKMIERTGQGKPLSDGAYNFLWVLLFTSGWLRQLEI